MNFMSTMADTDRSPTTSAHSASALNLISGTWVEGRGNTNRDICNPADTAEVLAPVREAAPEQVDEACAAAYGDLFAQGADAVAFYTRKKVITERWSGAEGPKEGWV